MHACVRNIQVHTSYSIQYSVPSETAGEAETQKEAEICPYIWRTGHQQTITPEAIQVVH